MKVILRFHVQAGDSTYMKYVTDKCVFVLFVGTDHFFAPRRVEAWRNLLWLPLGSGYYYCVGWGDDLYCIFLEDCVGGELCTSFALGL